MKKLNLIIFISLICFAFTFCSSSNKMKESKNVIILPKGSSKIIPFYKDSLSLNKEAIQILNEQAAFISKSIGTCYIIIYPWCSVNEIKANPNIGIIRSKAIIDFYEQVYLFPRSSFVIMDLNHLDDADWILVPDRNDPFVYLEIFFCNPKKTIKETD